MKKEAQKERDLQIGRSIRAARIAAGMSQGALGRAMQWSHGTVSEIEKGQRSVKFAEAPDIAAALGLGVAELFPDLWVASGLSTGVRVAALRARLQQIAELATNGLGE